MSLTKTVLQSLERSILLSLGRDLRVNVAVDDTKDALISELMARRRTALPVILEHLPKPELRGICRRLGLPDGGMPRADLVYRILSCPEENWKNPKSDEELEKLTNARRRSKRGSSSRSRKRSEGGSSPGTSGPSGHPREASSGWTQEKATSMGVRRRNLGIPQRKMARLLGVKQSTISMWENAHASPSEEAQRKIEKLLKDSQEELPASVKNEEMGPWISTKRKQLGLTQKELAGQVGVSTATVSLWETGQTTPSFRARRKVLDLLNKEGLADEMVSLNQHELLKDLLVTRRKQLGLTQKEFAEKLQVSQAAISIWEKGGTEPRPGTKRRLLKILQDLPVSKSAVEASRGDLPQWIASRRQRKGLTQKDLAQKLETSHSTVSLWENGKIIPRPATQRRILELLGENSPLPDKRPSRRASGVTGRGGKKGRGKRSQATTKSKAPTTAKAKAKKSKAKARTNKPLPQSARILEIKRQAEIERARAAEAGQDDEGQGDSGSANGAPNGEKAKKLRPGEKAVRQGVIRRKRPSNETQGDSSEKAEKANSEPPHEKDH